MLISLLAHQSFPMELSELCGEILSRQVFLCSLKWERARGWPLPPPCRREHEGGVGEVEHTPASSLSTCIRHHLYHSNRRCEEEQELKSMRRVFWWFDSCSCTLAAHHFVFIFFQMHPNTFFVSKPMCSGERTNKSAAVSLKWIEAWIGFSFRVPEDRMTWWLLYWDAFAPFISLGMSYTEFGYSYSAAPQVSTVCASTRFLNAFLLFSLFYTLPKLVN